MISFAKKKGKHSSSTENGVFRKDTPLRKTGALFHELYTKADSPSLRRLDFDLRRHSLGTILSALWYPRCGGKRPLSSPYAVALQLYTGVSAAFANL